jgi:aspartate-semialdehyde dehydrogenase
VPARLNVSITGAHTAVGREIIRTLEEREFPFESVSRLAPEDQVRDAPDGEGPQPVTPLKPDSFRSVEIAFFAGDARLSRTWIPAALEAGSYVIDLTSEHRADASIPLCVPPIAPFVRSERRIAACPDALTTAVARALDPLRSRTHLTRVTLTSLHSVSTRGLAAVRELELQIAALMNARAAEPKVFKHRVAFNAFPEVGPSLGAEFGDEHGVEAELPRVLDSKDLAVGATCVRVPIFYGNAASVSCEADAAIDVSWLKGALTGTPGVKLLDDPAEHVYPTTQLAVGDDSVLVGRVRPDAGRTGGVSFFISYDPIRLAATNAVAVAEAVVAG